MGEEIKLIVLDVDGTMTDGSIYYDDTGNEIKKFNTRDAAAIKVALCLGIRIIVVTGRKCGATERRMADLGINELYQNEKDKYAFLESFMVRNQIGREQVAYIGDDVNDLGAMKLAGHVYCPYDSCQEVKELCEFVSEKKGGDGAVRDILETLFRSNGTWDDAVTKIYRKSGI